jgi:hypothetical protein
MSEKTGDGAKVVPLKGRPCPMCGRPARLPHRPFCSRRCADLDLGRWLKGDYRIAAADDEDDDAPPRAE